MWSRFCRPKSVVFTVVTCILTLSMFYNNLPVFIQDRNILSSATRANFAVSRYNVHNHKLNQVDPFLDYSNSQNCTVKDLLSSCDESFNNVDSNVFCDGRAKDSDVVCRWFFTQIGTAGVHDDMDICRRTGSENRVPKIVYYVIFGPYLFEFYHYVSVVAAKRFINPSAIYVIGNEHPIGEWWTQVMKDVSGLRFVYRDRPPGIAGQPVGWPHHLSDLVRLQVLYANGGIYLDTDLVVTRPLDPLFDYDITMGLLDNDTGMGNALITAKRGSIFVRKWYESYLKYDKTMLYRNSLQVPRDLWHRDPASIHMETDRIYKPNWYEKDILFKENDYDWSDNFAIHVWTNDTPLPRNFTDINTLNTTLGKIFRHVLYGSTEFRTGT